MNIHVSIFLLFISLISFAQQSKAVRSAELKKQIIVSKEVLDWQNAMIAYQKSNFDFCALKYEQELNHTLFVSCGKPAISESFKDYTLNLFRTMRLTDELRESSIHKERILRTKFPQLATHFKFDEIFPLIYGPIRTAREEYLKTEH